MPSVNIAHRVLGLFNELQFPILQAAKIPAPLPPSQQDPYVTGLRFILSLYCLLCKLVNKLRNTTEANLRIPFLPLVYRIFHSLPLNLLSLFPLPFINCFMYFIQPIYLFSVGGIYSLQTESLYTSWSLCPKHPPLRSLYHQLVDCYSSPISPLNDLSIAIFFDLLNYIQVSYFFQD